MKKINNLKLIAIVSLLLLAILLKIFVFGNGKKIQPEIYRPVTALELKESDPELSLMLTGVVKSWKEEYFSFEVPGRVNWVIEKGTEIGNDIDSSKETVIARIDPTRYELKLKSLKAKIESAKAKAESLKVSIQEVMLRQLEAIDANLENSKLKFQRQKLLFERNAVSREAYDNAKTNYKVAIAEKAEALATVNTKKAEYRALLAQVEELHQNALDAELNIKKCTLKTSYSGKIAEVYANSGANVQAGARVLKVVVMNPMLISLEVSPDIDRTLRYRDQVKVFPSGIDKAVPALVSMKSTVADPQTHTFNLELFVQNPKVPVAGNLNGLAKLPEISGVWRTFNLRSGKYKNRTASSAEAFNQDGKGYFVWKAVKDENSKRGAVIYTLTKKYVDIESKIFDPFGVYSYRIFKENNNEISDNDLLAFGVPENVKSGQKVIEIARRWLFRPGDLAKVILTHKNTPSGIYVPIESIFTKNDESFVYLLQDVPQKHFCKVKKVKIRLLNQLGSFQRISSPEINNGDRIVLSGVHYINADDEVIIKELEEIEL